MIPRLYCPLPLAAGTTLVLPPEAAHHARDVLRLGPGDEITLLNGLGGEYRARLATADKKQVSVEILEFRQRESEPPYPITVAQSLATGDKMDWVIEKSVELGAAAIVPLAAARSVLRLDAARAAKRAAHWQAIVQAACEQCGRNRVPTLAAVTQLLDWLATQTAAPGLKLMLSPVHAKKFSDLAPPAAGTPITLLIGPEAGLSDAEEAAAEAAGFTAILLGPRVMRTETAALAALAAIHGRWGDF
ncbi:MAG TPA: 16S rRNA (uracil(1498)-N(3))-methyltransferase [Burkholderiales bacterium]|nr:16S rRNA (uracil(1498)-N(3))-methyltransferase [Burkholderiales bacterium]